MTLAIQIFTALAAAASAVLAPKIAPDFGISQKLVGVFVGLVYSGSMVSSLISGGFIGRYGAIRVSQACVLLCAAGIALMGVLPPPLAAGLVLVPVVVGLGYGPITPASSQILARTASADRMALTFSIKQTGVPAGVALAGLLLPGLALTVGWRLALFAVTGVGFGVVLLAQVSRASLDTDRQEIPVRSLPAAIASLKLVTRDRALRELSLTGTAYAATQNCLTGFLVVYLTESLGLSLVTAGLALTVANAAGIAGRIVWGVVADAYMRSRTLLGLLGLGAGTCAFFTAAFTSTWPMLLTLTVCAAFGATASGWNGVQLADLARHAPAGQAGAVTGASGFVTFSGVVLGPPIFATLALLTGSYRVGFRAFGLLSLGCGLWLLSTRRR